MNEKFQSNSSLSRCEKPCLTRHRSTICSRFGRHLYSTKCSWIVRGDHRMIFNYSLEKVYPIGLEDA